MSMRNLLFGLLEFREQSRSLYADHFRQLSKRQTPQALFIACADSRVVPSLLTSAEPGDLFTMRNVGNLVPPAREDGTSSGDLSEASAIEYAVAVLKVPNVVVCGHSNCGAIRAIVTGSMVDDAPNLGKWLDHARPALAMASRQPDFGGGRPLQDRVSQANVLVQLEHLCTYPSVRRGLEDRTLAVAGWWFDITTGDMLVHDRANGIFAPLDRQSISRLAGGG
jgi:carbonic anhydrase